MSSTRAIKVASYFWGPREGPDVALDHLTEMVDELFTEMVVDEFFFRAHNGELFTEMVGEFQKRNQRAAAVDSHCKVMALAFASGERFAVEGSANLFSNGSAREQFCLVNDAGIHDFHAAWISEMAARYEDHESDTPTAG
jgi:hypothetical protein